MEKMKRPGIKFLSCLGALLTTACISYGFFASPQTQEFQYTGNVEEWTAPRTGIYKISATGASGGGYKNGSEYEEGGEGGLGGMVSGEIMLMEGQKLYVLVGQEGDLVHGGFNGGGNGRNGGRAGGGATQITTVNRETLTNFSNNRDEILLVAGGGGGRPSSLNFHGGTSTTDLGSGGTVLIMSDTRDTYNLGYKFGLGEDAANTPSSDGGYSGAGGGGFTGGKCGDVNKIGQRGFGGASFIDTDRLSEIAHVSGINLGNGKASIQFVKEVETTLMIDLGFGGTIDGKEAVEYTNTYGNTITIPDPETKQGYVFEGWQMIDGDGTLDGNDYTFQLSNTIIRARYTAKLELRKERRWPENQLDLFFKQPDDFVKFYKVVQSEDQVNWSPVHSNNDDENYTLDVTYTSNASLTVKRSGRYLITVSGAMGGAANGSGNPKSDEGWSRNNPGYGVTGTGTVWLKAGTSLGIYPGSAGGSAGTYYAGGGGYSAYAGGGGGQTRSCCSHFTVYGGGGGGGTGITANGSWIASAQGGNGASAQGYGMSSNPGWAYGGGGGGTTNVYNAANAIWRTGLSTRYSGVPYGYARIQYIDSLITEESVTNVALKDKAAPDPVSDMIRDENYETTDTHLTWSIPDDHGTKYWFKVMSYLENSDDTLKTSNIVDDTYTSGTRGFYYYVDVNPGGTVTKSHSFTANNELTLPQYPDTRWIHIATVDYAGNLSTTYHFKILSVAKYTVNHYAQNEDGTYALVESEEFIDTIGKTVTPETHVQTGRDVPEKQSIVITQDGSAVVNYYYDVTRFDINGTVAWNDHENVYGTRPDSATVNLYRDGEYFDTVDVDSSNIINPYSFDRLQKYDLMNGREFVYTVEQETAYSQAALVTSEDKYQTEKDGYDFLNTIRNTEPDMPNPDKPDDKGLYVEGSIYWEDNDDSLGFRPSTTTITLYQKGEDGKWTPFREPIIVDSFNENHYLFDWLPKYWYDENDIPTAYEYKVEEKFEAWYIKDGVMKDAYTIIADQPKNCDFTNIFNMPDTPIIPVKEYLNTLTIKTNTNETVRVVLKPLELFINSDYSVSYGKETGDDILVKTNNSGTMIKDIPSMRYEIVMDSPEFTLEGIKLILSENMELEQTGGKWYLTIKNVPADTIGTLDITLSKNKQYYQDRHKMMNYFSVETPIKTEESTEYLIMEMSDAVITPNSPVTITYMNSNTKDNTVYMQEEKAKILDYLGKISAESEFIGWSKMPESSEAEYMVDDTVELTENLVLYPIFESTHMK